MKKIYGIKVSQPLGDFFIAKIKAKSEAIGIPYQTLMTIKMHEFANN